MPSKTMTMKVDLSCCDECVLRMKRLLKRFEGVESISIDVKNSVVIVSGQLDNPEKIIDNIREKGKTVTLFSIQFDYDDDDDIDNVKDSLHPNTKPKKSGKNSEKGKSEQCKVHGGRREGQGCGNRCFYGSENMRKSEHHCGSSRAEEGMPKFHTHDCRRVYFGDHCGGHGFDSVHYYGHRPCHVPQQQFQNCHRDFGFKDDTTLDCRIM